MSVTMQVTGVAELSKALGSLSTRMSRKIQRDALVEAAEPIRRQASATAPRAPGEPDLADNIVISNARPADGSVGVVVGPSKPFFYGTFQEWGTSRHGAQPFMRPAFDGNVQTSFKSILVATRRILLSKGLIGSARTGGGGGLL